MCRNGKTVENLSHVSHANQLRRIEGFREKYQSTFCLTIWFRQLDSISGCYQYRTCCNIIAILQVNFFSKFNPRSVEYDSKFYRNDIFIGTSEEFLSKKSLMITEN